MSRIRSINLFLHESDRIRSRGLWHPSQTTLREKILEFKRTSAIRVQWIVEVCDSPCLGCWRFFISNFDIIFPKVRMWFRRIGMSRRGWRLCFPHSPAFAQIKHRSVEPCPSLSAVYWFCSLCNKNRLKLRNIIHSFKRFCNLLEKNFRALMLSWGFYAFITGYFIYKFLGKI
jgi:hypothetical protein